MGHISKRARAPWVDGVAGLVRALAGGVLGGMVGAVCGLLAVALIGTLIGPIGPLGDPHGYAFAGLLVLGIAGLGILGAATGGAAAYRLGRATEGEDDLAH